MHCYQLDNKLKIFLNIFFSIIAIGKFNPNNKFTIQIIYFLINRVEIMIQRFTAINETLTIIFLDFKRSEIYLLILQSNVCFYLHLLGQLKYIYQFSNLEMILVKN